MNTDLGQLTEKGAQTKPLSASLIGFWQCYQEEGKKSVMKIKYVLEKE